MRRWMTVALMMLIAGAGSQGASAQTSLVPGGLTAMPQANVGANLVQNGAFETLSGGLPTGWTGGSGWGIDQLVKHGGTYSYRRTTGAGTSAQSVTLKKGIYKLRAWIKLEGLGSGSSSGVRLQLDYRPGGINDWVPSDVISGTADWKEYVLGPIVVASDRKASVYLENYGNPAGTAWFDDVRLEEQLPQPVDVFMLYPNYRGMLFDDQSQTMRFDVTVNPPSGSDVSRYKVTATLAAETSGTVIATQSYAAAANFEASLPGGGMQTGQGYLVRFALVDTTSNATIYTFPAYRVSKVPAAQRATMNVAFDENNRVLLHGTPRFVLGVYDSGSSYGNSDAWWENQLWSPTGERRMDNLKINMYLNYWYGAADATSMNALMANLDKHGVMYLQTGNCFATWAAGPNNFAIDTSDNYVQTIGAQRGSAGYYTADECVSSLQPDTFTQYQRLKKLDPDSMTFAALLASPPDVFLWRDSADIISTDPYPMYGAEPAGGYPMNRVADWTDAARDAVKNARPYMTVLQFFKFTSQGRWPTRQEMRNHAWMAIVQGAKGLWWWSLGDNALLAVCSGWCAEKTQHMDDLKAVVNEIAALEPALLADDAATALTSNSNAAAIKTKAKVVGGKGYLFAYNYTNTTQSATFGWNTAPGTVTVNAENRTITASGSSFSDSFAPYQAHVYLIGNGGTGGGGGGGTAPTVSITNPAAGATVSGTTTVSMTAAGGSGSGYSYALAVDGTTIYSGANGTFSWNTTTASNAQHTLTATVTDSAGQKGTVTRTVTVSNATPSTLTLAFTAPASGATVSGTTTVTLSASGSSGYTYSLAVDGSAVAGSGPSFSWNTTTAANGQHTLTGTVSDAAGQTATATRTVMVSNSTTPPPGASLQVSVTQPTGGTRVSGTNWAVIWVSGTSGTSNTYTLSAGGKTVATQTTSSTGPVSIPWATTAVADGAQTLTASVKDAMGGTGNASVAVMVSNGITPLPTDLRLSFLSPAANATVSGTTTVSLAVAATTAGSTASAPAATYTYRLAVDGTPVAGTGPSFSWNTATATNGPHTLTGTVTDSSGVTATATRTVTVSNTVPPPSTGSLRVSMTRPGSGATLSGTSWAVLWVSGASGTSNTYTLSVAGRTVATQTTSSTGPVSVAWNTTTVADGAQTLTASVRDATGKTGSVSMPVTVRNATVTPTPTPTLTAAFTSPAAGATVGGTTTIGMSATGSAAGTRTFRLTIDGRAVSTQLVTGTTASYTWATTALPNGSHTLTLLVIDSEGTRATVTRTVTVANTTTAPPAPTGTLRVSVTAPGSNAIVSGTAWAVLWVSGASGTANTFTMSVNGRVVGTQTVSSTGPVAMPWNTTTAANGTQVLTVTVKDATGNTGTAGVSVTVRN